MFTSLEAPLNCCCALHWTLASLLRILLSSMNGESCHFFHDRRQKHSNWTEQHVKVQALKITNPTMIGQDSRSPSSELPNSPDQKDEDREEGG